MVDEIKNTSDSHLQTTLSSLGDPVERLRFTGKADTFITWQTIAGSEAAFADDDSEEYEHTYRVDLFSKHNYVEKLVALRKALKVAGFYGTQVLAEQFEGDTGYYHASLNTNFMEV
ncbi:MAG: hypothetical protein FWE91_09835 [Defluviitaleaceae bacterium]|nr:hypothetical protein [Defluviitaleaceae bacterium]